jgi:hypothetical protein
VVLVCSPLMRNSGESTLALAALPVKATVPAVKALPFKKLRLDIPMLCSPCVELLLSIKGKLTLLCRGRTKPVTFLKCVSIWLKKGAKNGFYC